MTANRPLPTQALIRAAKALRFALIIKGAVRWSVLSAGGLLALLLVDDLFHLPQALRLPLAVVLVGFIVIEFYRKVLRPALKPMSPARAARLLETNRGIAGNVLINAYQFERDKSHAGWRKYVGPVLDSSSSILENIPQQSLWLTPTLKKWIRGLLILVVAWVAVVFYFPKYVATGMERIFLPLADIPPVGSWNMDLKPNRTVKLVEGDRLDITVRLNSALGFKGKAPTPVVVWQDDAGVAESTFSAGEHATMVPTGKPNEFAFSFNSVGRSFSFRIWADDSRSTSVRVEVSPLPQVKGSVFEITPPAYTGLKKYSQPGPPATLEVPAGSMVKATLNLSPDSPQVTWREVKKETPLTHEKDGWKMTRMVNESSDYDLLAALPGQTVPRVLGKGQVTAVPDRPPEVDFVSQDRNRAVNPGGTLPVTVRATDDYGIASISIRIAAGDDAANVRVLKTWTYLGPPGQKEPTPETYAVELNPAIFTPGSSYLLTAQATDYSPAGQRTTSRPIVVRVAGIQEMAVPQGDALEKLFDLLRSTIAAQTRANGLTDNLTLHLAEAIAAKDVTQHCGGMTDAQKQAQDFGNSALDEADKHDEGKMYHARLDAVIKGEMGLAMGQLSHLVVMTGDLAPPLDALQKRQVYILNELVSLFGQMATQRQQAAEALAKKASDVPPALTMEQQLGKLKDELKAFGDDQKRIINASKPFRELNPEDLTTDQQAVLGELARQEAKQAAYFQEKLTDLSKLPLQDFADGKIVGDMNAVFQEVQKASEAMYQKRMEIATPAAQGGLEKAAEIEQNLEKWLPNTPDNTKWSMEEPQGGPQDIPMAELPKQLDDLIGDLLKKEKDMDPDKDDPSSSIMDSMDKGAGWGADDGPMSNMSAKGVTGNQLPNNNEITGRSGEGRNGKSNGQMVGNTAVGKGGAETPTRMTPTPFENGSVNDQSKDDKGGATGGGKLAGFGQDGLRGPMAPQTQQKVHMLAQQQEKLRQQVESLALQLRKQRRPTGDLESAVAAMKALEASAQNQDGLQVVQGYHQALDSLEAARSEYAGQRLSRVESDAITKSAHSDVSDSQAQDAPPGYEEMTGAYFRSLSDSPAAAASTPAASAPAPSQ